MKMVKKNWIEGCLSERLGDISVLSGNDAAMAVLAAGGLYDPGGPG
jgi:hypothetical protein